MTITEFLDKNKRYIFAAYLITLWATLNVAGIGLTDKLEVSIGATVVTLIASAIQKSKPQ